VAGAKGSVALSEESCPYDVNEANDKADILLDVEGGGSTGRSGSAGGSGSTGGGGTTGIRDHRRVLGHRIFGERLHHRR